MDESLDAAPTGLPNVNTIPEESLLLSPRTRRRQRGRGTVVLDNVTTASAMTNPTAITPELLNSINSMSGRNFRMNPSPDEMVIAQRGRREVPLTFSPDVYSHTATPQQRSYLRQRYQQPSGKASGGNSSMSRLLLPTRTSPRKKLTLGDDAPVTRSLSASLDEGILASSSAGARGDTSGTQTPSPERGVSRRASPITKKYRNELARSSTASPLVLMKGLSHGQLLDLFSKVLKDQPDLEPRVVALMPPPDLAAMEEKLSSLKKNIFRTLPNTRLESRTDSMAYNRVYIHLLALKKEVTDQSKRLIDSQHWAVAVEHAVMAWGYVHSTPVWDNLPHNNTRKQCFKSLGANCLAAIKKMESCIDADVAQVFKSRILSIDKEADELAPCIKHLDTIIRGHSKN